MQSRTKNVLTIRFSSDAKVNSFLNTIRDGENPFSFKKILQLSDDPKATNRGQTFWFTRPSSTLVQTRVTTSRMDLRR